MALPSTSFGGKGTKSLVPLILGAVAIGMVAALMTQLQRAKHLETQLRRSEQQRQQVEADNQSLLQQRQEAEGEHKRLEHIVATLRKELAAAAAGLDRSHFSLEELQGRYEDLQATQAKLESRLTSVTEERDAKEASVETLEGEKAELQRSVGRLRERLVLLDRDYRALTDQLARAQAMPNTGVSAVIATGPRNHGSGGKMTAALSPSTVELPPIVVRKDHAGMSIPVRGRILEVNEPHHFIVVDKGTMDGVRVGMTFDIVRGASQIGRATVVRVRPQLSACDILRAKTSGPLQSGDQAVQSGP